MVEYILHAITLLAAFMGIFGKTTKEDPTGKTSLTTVGLFTIALAAFAFCGSIYRTNETHEAAKVDQGTISGLNEQVRGARTQLTNTQTALEQVKLELGTQIGTTNAQLRDAQKSLGDIGKAASAIERGTSDTAQGARTNTKALLERTNANAKAILDATQNLGANISTDQQGNTKLIAGIDATLTNLSRTISETKALSTTDLDRLKAAISKDLDDKLGAQKASLVQRIDQLPEQVIKKLTPPVRPTPQPDAGADGGKTG